MDLAKFALAFLCNGKALVSHDGKSIFVLFGQTRPVWFPGLLEDGGNPM